MIGRGYDGTACSHEWNGVQAYLRKDLLLAIYVLCASYSMKLISSVIVLFCSVSTPYDTDETDVVVNSFSSWILQLEFMQLTLNVRSSNPNVRDDVTLSIRFIDLYEPLAEVLDARARSNRRECGWERERERERACGDYAAEVHTVVRVFRGSDDYHPRFKGRFKATWLESNTIVSLKNTFRHNATERSWTSDSVGSGFVRSL